MKKTDNKMLVVKRPCGKIVATHWDLKSSKEFIKTWENKEGYTVETINENLDLASIDWSCDYFCACDFKLSKKE